MNDPSAGEIGGIFAGAIALLIALGHGLRWWLGWTDQRALTRAAKLDAWQRELEARENRFNERIRGELDELRASDQARAAELGLLKTQYAALRTAHQLITRALRRSNPLHPALAQADDILKATYPIDLEPPADMAKTILAAKRSDDGKAAP